MNERNEITSTPWELVTAPTTSPDRLTGEAAELQETWQAFQELLKKTPGAETPSWAAALVDELEPQTIEAPAIASTPAGRSTTSERFPWRMVLVSLAMAGCMAGVAFVGLAKLWQGVGVGRDLLVERQTAGKSTATIAARSGGDRDVESNDARPLAQTTTSDAPVAERPRDTAPDYEAISWDDPLDWQLDQATQSLATMRERWRSRASGYEMWQLQLEQLRADLDGGAL